MFKFQIASTKHTTNVFYWEENDPYLDGDTSQIYDCFVYGTRDIKTLLWTAYYDYNGQIISQCCNYSK